MNAKTERPENNRKTILKIRAAESTRLLFMHGAKKKGFTMEAHLLDLIGDRKTPNELADEVANRVAERMAEEHSAHIKTQTEQHRRQLVSFTSTLEELIKNFMMKLGVFFKG